MLYHLIHPFISQFKYITFRAAGASVVAFLICLIIGPKVIALLKRKKMLEHAEKKDSERLTELHKNKSQTPTMGGIFVLLALFLATVLWARLDNIFILNILLILIGYGALGLFDDLVKWRSATKSGLPKEVKFLGQFVIGLALGFSLWYYFSVKLPAGIKLYLPLLKTSVDLGLFYPYFVALVITACSNAVNLTDGLDGLATGCLIMAALAYAVISYISGRVDYTAYLNIPYIPGSGELSIVCAALAGAGLGFLWFNCFPATIFMGNTGATPLGAILGFVAICTKQELVLCLVGAIFVVESVSVILQVISYRWWHKRFFRIAPLHHHYQFQGMAEPKITVRFWIVAAILALLSLATLKIEIF